MEYYYKKSLHMIKILKIQTKRDYERLLDNYLLLSVESLKYITQTRNFKNIIKLAKEVWKGLLFKIDRKFYISTIVDKKYGISKNRHTKDKGGKKWE